MAKYYAEMVGEEGRFEYSLEAGDIFEADERFQEIAANYGWDFIEAYSKDTEN